MKVKKIKENILFFILGGIVCSVVMVLADTIAANLVSYDTSTSHSNYNTVQGAIDNLYNISDDLYDKVPNSTGLAMIANGAPGLSSTLIDELYRYQGTTADNYICFGTTDKDTCIGTALVGTENEADRYDKYMYRIIGVNSSGQMKLIKKEALNTTYQWHTANGVEWPNASLKAGLNGSYFLTNTTYVPSGWEDRIATVAWHYLTTTDTTASTIGARELEAATTQAKIGLMYLHDWADAYESTPTYSGTSWIFLWQAQNDSNAPHNDYEWTISRHDTNYPWSVRKTFARLEDTYPSTSTRSVRPVFFLTSSQVIESGSGTLTDPYILT